MVLRAEEVLVGGVGDTEHHPAGDPQGPAQSGQEHRVLGAVALAGLDQGLLKGLHVLGLQFRVAT